MASNNLNNNNILHVPVRLQNEHPARISQYEYHSLTKPVPIGFFCVNRAREFQNDAEFAGYFFKPKLPIDLKIGLDKVIRKPVEPPFHDIQLVCSYIKSSKNNLIQQNDLGVSFVDADVITCRGILRLIMCTPYDTQKDWGLMATYFNGTIYLSKMETDRQRSERENATIYNLELCSMGFKFEQYCTSREPNLKPDTSVPVNENEEFNCVYHSKLGKLKLLYAAEMDAIESQRKIDIYNPEELRSVEFTELKTSFSRMNCTQRTFTHVKSLNWWSQSYLVGINTINAGMRNNNGIVIQIKQFKVDELPSQKPWKRRICLQFLEIFLIELKKLMQDIKSPYSMVQLHYKPNQDIIAYTVLTDGSPQMIPDWYRELFRSKPLL